MNTEPQNPQGGHDVPLTPPPASSGAPASGVQSPPVPPAASVPPAPSSQGPSSQSPSSQGPRSGAGARAAAIAVAVFGGVVLLGTGATAAVAAVHDVSRSSSTVSGDVLTVDVKGIESIDLEVGASAVSTRFGDVDEATLEVTGTRGGNWRLDRDGDELIVRGPDHGFGWFGNGWLGGNWFGDNLFDEESAILTLPESLNNSGLDADFDLSAGSLTIDGSFGEVGIAVGAGILRMEGSATSVDVELSAGRADLELADVTEAEFSLSAGKLVADLTGDAPRTVSIDVSAGALELTVPDESYDVTQDVSAGSLDNRLDTSSSSQHTIDATVSAGSAILRSGN
ncbi:DUF4097 family beta strand repeat-containing protein [Microbacterium sp. A82]|uniref:DUF4097 family beta strand repeat-containing protein n=1 Tax=Microbacterium sp. A82 TaxID=3450452 RepID=UPI003F2DE91D